MSYLRYYGELLSTAFSQSLDTAQAVIFVLIIATGLIVYIHPSAKMPVDWNGWQAAALVFVGIVAVRLIFAPFWMARGENEKLIETQKEISTLKSDGPKFEGAIEQIMWGGTVTGHTTENKEVPMESMMAMIVSISNVGNRPSIAKEWKLTAIQGDKAYSTTFNVPAGMTLSGDGRPTVSYFKEDTLYVKAAKAIQPGDMVQGTLMARVIGIDTKLLKPGTFRLVLNFKDVTGKEYTITRNPENEGHMIFAPGLKQEIQ